MDMITVILALIIGLVGLVLYVTKDKNIKKDKQGIAGVLLMAFAVALVAMGAVGVLSFSDGTDGTSVSIGNSVAVPDVPVQIGTSKISITAIDAMSGSRSTASGTVEYFASNVNPLDPTASSIDTVSITSGVGNTTDGLLTTDTILNVIFNGGSSYYDISTYQEMFAYITNVDTQNFVREIQVYGVGTIADPLNDADTDYFNSGSATVYNPAGEVTSSTNAVTYNTTKGSNGYVIPLKIQVTGSDVIVKDMALCFKWDETNPPNGDEYTSIVATPLSGSQYSALSGNLVSYWSTQSCIQLGDVNGGSLALYNLQFTTVDANIDANDDWKLRLDDLGAYLAQDVALGTKASAQTITFDHTA